MRYLKYYLYYFDVFLQKKRLSATALATEAEGGEEKLAGNAQHTSQNDPHTSSQTHSGNLEDFIKKLTFGLFWNVTKDFWDKKLDIVALFYRHLLI